MMKTCRNDKNKNLYFKTIIINYLSKANDTVKSLN